MKVNVIKNRIILFLIFMGLFSLVYQISAMMQPSEEEAAEFLEEFEEATGDIDANGIFLHNSGISLLMFIPGAGLGWGLFSAWETGFAFASIASLVPELADIQPLMILYVSPFGFMELAAYSIAMSRSYILVTMIVRKKNLKMAIKPTLIEVGVLLSLLFAGAHIEMYIIELSEQGVSIF